MNYEQCIRPAGNQRFDFRHFHNFPIPSTCKKTKQNSLSAWVSFLQRKRHMMARSQFSACWTVRHLHCTFPRWQQSLLDFQRDQLPTEAELSELRASEPYRDSPNYALDLRIAEVVRVERRKRRRRMGKQWRNFEWDISKPLLSSVINEAFLWRQYRAFNRRHKKCLTPLNSIWCLLQIGPWERKTKELWKGVGSSFSTKSWMQTKRWRWREIPHRSSPFSALSRCVVKLPSAEKHLRNEWLASVGTPAAHEIIDDFFTCSSWVPGSTPSNSKFSH